MIKFTPKKYTILGTVVGVALASGYGFSQRSLDNIATIHPRLQEITQCALKHSTHDFIVIEGKRSLEQHKINLSKGASKIGRSKHIDGLAVDVAAYSGGITWDSEPYKQIAASFYHCSEKLETPIIWGGEWVKLRDMVHFELKEVKMVNGVWTYVGD